MNEREYQLYCKTGSTQPLVATKMNTRSQTVSAKVVTRPKGEFEKRSYTHTAIKVTRKGVEVAKRELSFLALELINDRKDSAKFRRLIAE